MRILRFLLCLCLGLSLIGPAQARVVQAASDATLTAMLHGGVGCLSADIAGGSCGSGFAVGFGTELVAGRLGDSFAADPAMDAQGQQAARLAFEQDRAALVGAALGYITSGGNAVNVNQGASLARSAVAYNRQLHLNEKETLTRLLGRDVGEDIFDGDLEALTPEDRALLAAACGFVHCSDHINADDPTYAQRLALQQEGRKLIASRSSPANTLLANAATAYSSASTITMLNAPGMSGRAQGGFLYTGTDARMDLAQAMGYDIYGQARADVIAAMPGAALDGAINLGAGALAFTGCAGGVALDCEAFVKQAGEAITTTVAGIRAIPGYPDMLRDVDLATVRFIYGEIDRTTYATILADAGRLQGGADAVIVSLGLGGAVSGLRLPSGNAPDVMAPNAGTRPDFYVSPNGEAVEGTLYRYSDSAYADDILQNSGSPGIDGRGHYLGTEALGSASSVRDRYQIAPEWSNPTVRGELDSIQLYDPNTGTWRLQTPTSNGNTTTIPEPYTSTYPEYGTGGARQYITDQNTSIRYDNVDIIGD